VLTPEQLEEAERLKKLAGASLVFSEAEEDGSHRGTEEYI
jgi:hypothetical protein